MAEGKFKGEPRPEISLLYIKVLTCSCTRRSKTKILTTRAPLSWIEFDVVTSQRQTQSASDCVMLLESITWDSQAIFLALVVNILVFDLRVQLQHCTYQRKTFLFALIKVSTFICNREISGLSSPLSYRAVKMSNICLINMGSPCWCTTLVHKHGGQRTKAQTKLNFSQNGQI